MHYIILFILSRWVVGIWLVMKLTSDDLLDRLKKKGTREPAFTKALIIKKLNDDDDDVATTSLKVRIILCTSVMRVGSDTFGNPIFQKGLQN